MHIGKNNPSVDYKLNGKNIKETKIEKDLGVYVQDNLKFERQINDSVRKANNMVRIIKHTFTYLDSKSLSILYKTYIRPHLEYCVQAWSPYLHKDVDKLESVQRSVTKILPNFKNLPYHQRLAELGLTTLQERRVRGDLIEVYKIVEGIDDISENFLPKLIDDGRTRGHNRKLFKGRSNTTKRLKFFNQRVVDEWNKLPPHVVNATSVNSFKKEYDRFVTCEASI